MSGRRRCRAAVWMLLIAASAGGCGGSSRPRAAEPTPSPVRYASDRSAQIGSPAASAAARGKVVAALDFDVGRDAFSFENFGWHAQTDLRTAELRELFGDEVCANGPSDTCALTPAAAQWRVQMNDLMRGGHCYGMSVT